MVLMNLFAGRTGDTAAEERLVGPGRRERGRVQEQQRHTYTIMCETDSGGKSRHIAASQPGSFDDLEAGMQGGGGSRGGRSMHSYG